MYYLGRKPNAEEVLAFRRVLEQRSEYAYETIERYVKVFEEEGKMEDAVTRFFRTGFF